MFLLLVGSYILITIVAIAIFYQTSNVYFKEAQKLDRNLYDAVHKLSINVPDERYEELAVYLNEVRRAHVNLMKSRNFKEELFLWYGSTIHWLIAGKAFVIGCLLLEKRNTAIAIAIFIILFPVSSKVIDIMMHPQRSLSDFFKGVKNLTKDGHYWNKKRDP